MIGSKWFSWIGLIGGVAAQVVEARELVGDAITSVATIVALVAASLGNAVFRPKSTRTED